MGYTKDRNAIKISLEATPGTWVAPAIVLPLEKGTGLFEPEVDKDESNPVSGHHGSRETQAITAFSGVSFSPSMKLPSDHTLIAPLFAMCGVAATAIQGGTSYAYDSTKKTTASLEQISERKITQIYGARASFSLSCEVGKAAEISFDFESQLKEVIDLAAVDNDNVIPSTPAFEKVFMTKDCTAYLVNGQNAHFKKVDFTLGGDIKRPKDTCSGECYTEDIKPELQVTMAATPDTNGAFQDLKTGTEFNFVIPFFDINGVKKWELISPKCVVIDQKTPESEGLLNIERTLECRKVNGDDNWEIQTFHA